MAQGSREFGGMLDQFVARRKQELNVNARRASSRVRGWAGELGGESLAEAARAGRWSGLWAVMEERKAELLRILAGRDG